jgi:hypothetical protein
VYLAAERKNKDEIQGSFTPFRMMTSKGRKEDRFTGEEGDDFRSRSGPSSAAAYLVREKQVLIDGNAGLLPLAME